MPAQTMRYKNLSYFLPEAGDLVMKPGKTPYVSLRCTAAKAPDEWVSVNLPPTLAASAKVTLDSFVAQGYEVEDFCLRGTLTFEPFGYDLNESLEIHKKVRVLKVKTPHFVGTQVINLDEFEIRSSERPILHISPATGEVMHRKKQSTMVMGNITNFINEAKSARDAERDFKYAHLFIWKRRSRTSLLLQEFIEELEKIVTPTKILVI